VESTHHIFVHCVHFEEWRREAGEELLMRTERKLVEAGIVREEDQRVFLSTAKSLFADDTVVWPLKISQYYLGRIPRVHNHITHELISYTVKRRKLATRPSS